jgi:hypothetical protein
LASDQQQPKDRRIPLPSDMTLPLICWIDAGEMRRTT